MTKQMIHNTKTALVALVALVACVVTLLFATSNYIQANEPVEGADTPVVSETPVPCAECNALGGHEATCSQWVDPNACTECGLAGGTHAEGCSLAPAPVVEAAEPCGVCGATDGHVSGCLMTWVEVNQTGYFVAESVTLYANPNQSLSDAVVLTAGVDMPQSFTVQYQVPLTDANGVAGDWYVLDTENWGDAHPAYSYGYVPAAQVTFTAPAPEPELPAGCAECGATEGHLDTCSQYEAPVTEFEVVLLVDGDATVKMADDLGEFQELEATQDAELIEKYKAELETNAQLAVYAIAAPVDEDLVFTLEPAEGLEIEKVKAADAQGLEVEVKQPNTEKDEYLVESVKLSEGLEIRATTKAVEAEVETPAQPAEGEDDAEGDGLFSDWSEVNATGYFVSESVTLYTNPTSDPTNTIVVPGEGAAMPASFTVLYEFPLVDAEGVEVKWYMLDTENWAHEGWDATNSVYGYVPADQVTFEAPVVVPGYNELDSPDGKVLVAGNIPSDVTLDVVDVTATVDAADLGLEGATLLGVLDVTLSDAAGAWQPSSIGQTVSVTFDVSAYGFADGDIVVVYHKHGDNPADRYVCKVKGDKATIVTANFSYIAFDDADSLSDTLINKTGSFNVAGDTVRYYYNPFTSTNIYVDVPLSELPSSFLVEYAFPADDGTVYYIIDATYDVNGTAYFYVAATDVVLGDVTEDTDGLVTPDGLVKVTGNIPEGIELEVDPVEIDPAEFGIEDPELIYGALDIKLMNGVEEWQPAAGESVTITVDAASLGMADGYEYFVYHQHNGAISISEPYVVSDGKLVFPSFGFSIYVVVGTYADDWNYNNYQIVMTAGDELPIATSTNGTTYAWRITDGDSSSFTLANDNQQTCYVKASSPGVIELQCTITIRQTQTTTETMKIVALASVGSSVDDDIIFANIDKAYTSGDTEYENTYGPYVMKIRFEDPDGNVLKYADGQTVGDDFYVFDSTAQIDINTFAAAAPDGYTYAGAFFYWDGHYSDGARVYVTSVDRVNTNTAYGSHLYYAGDLSTSGAGRGTYQPSGVMHIVYAPVADVHTVTFKDHCGYELASYAFAHNDRGVTFPSGYTGNIDTMIGSTIPNHHTAHDSGYEFEGNWIVSGGGQRIDGTYSSSQLKSSITSWYITSNITITAQCSEVDVTIKYVASPEAGGSVALDSETVKAVSETPRGSDAVANDGYKFVGWYSEEGDLLSTNTHFVPEKVNGVNVSATYYARFVEYKITVTKVVSIEGWTDLSGEQKTALLGSSKPYSAKFELRDASGKKLKELTIQVTDQGTLKGTGQFDLSDVSLETLRSQLTVVEVSASTLTGYDASEPSYIVSKGEVTQNGASFTLDDTTSSASVQCTNAYTIAYADLTISKSGSQSIDIGQTFIFLVERCDSQGNVLEGDEAFSMRVSVCGDGTLGSSTVVIGSLKLGYYKVTELEDWSWRYTPTGVAAGSSSKVIELAAGGTQVQFINARDQVYWLSNGDFNQNVFN